MARDENSTEAVSNQLETAKSNADSETLQRQQTLSQSKGRAQITATTAMSIVNVALLKSVLDRGPDENRYYIISLTLISISLTLQVIAGLLSLMVEQVLGYLSKYTKNACEDMKENCCHWRFVRNPRYYATDSNPESHGYHEGNDEDVELASFPQSGRENGREPWEVTVHNHRNYSLPMSNSDEPICGCCPTTCTTNVYEKDEADAIHRCYLWKNRFMEDEMRMVRAQEELNNLRQSVTDSRNSLIELNKKLNTHDSDNTTTQKQIDEELKNIEKAETKIKSCEETINKMKINKSQGKILTEYSNAIQRNRVLHLAAFWQQILNYIFYIVFILNAFIVGFGLASDSN